MPKVRIDKLLVDKGLAPSREKAQALIMAGCVLVNEIPAAKPGQLVNETAKIRVTGNDHPYVGRGGVKLEHALREFKINAAGKVCVDVGASTGGFTDCLLQHGAAKVFAVDVGYGQLDWKIRTNPKVVVMERTNIRNVCSLAKHELAELAVVDVSFISLEKVFPHVDGLLEAGGTVVALIKPQFEAGKGRVGKGGIVRDDGLRREVVEKVCAAAAKIGWEKKGVTTSPITGADGNVEFLAWFVKG